MSHTQASVLVHCVFSTKNRANLIRNPEELWRYLAVVARDRKVILLAAGGTANHVHLLLAVPPALRGYSFTRTESAQLALAARARTPVCMAGRVRRVQRRPSAAPSSDGLHRRPGNAPCKMDFRAGVHHASSQIGRRVRPPVCVWMMPPLPGLGLLQLYLPSASRWAKLSRPAKRDLDRWQCEPSSRVRNPMIKTRLTYA
jgi:REP element-mobilizing transposase RayT